MQIKEFCSYFEKRALWSEIMSRHSHTPSSTKRDYSPFPITQRLLAQSPLAALLKSPCPLGFERKILMSWQNIKYCISAHSGKPGFRRKYCRPMGGLVCCIEPLPGNSRLGKFRDFLLSLSPVSREKYSGIPGKATLEVYSVSRKSCPGLFMAKQSRKLKFWGHVMKWKARCQMDFCLV